MESTSGDSQNQKKKSSQPEKSCKDKFHMSCSYEADTMRHDTLKHYVPLKTWPLVYRFWKNESLQ